jgi:ATP-dependent RNA helicase DHX37/DHR1
MLVHLTATRLILGKQGGCLPYVILIVATLSVRDPLLREAPEDSTEQAGKIYPLYIIKFLDNEANKKKIEELHRAHASWANEKSDLLVILKAIGAFEYSGATEQFCTEKYLHYKVCILIVQTKSYLSRQ